MAFIKFVNKKKPVEAQAEKLNNHHIKITGCAINTSGFLYYQDDALKRLYSDCSDYITLYHDLGDCFILSNDGSVYPDPAETAPKPEPTLREIVDEMGEELTNSQIAICENYEKGVEVSEELTNTQLAITELYEMTLGG